MGKAVFSIIGLVLGVVLGGFGALTLGGGAMMGMGVATGLSAGICSTVQAAQEEGIMTAEQVDQVLKRAAADLGSSTEVPADEQLVDSAAQCEAVLAKLADVSGK